MVQIGTPESVMTDARNDLRRNLSGQDPNPKNRATSDWIFCSVDDARENFNLPYINITMVDCPVSGYIDRDVSALHEMRLQFVVRSDRSSYRNTLRDKIPNALTLTNSSHHYEWTAITDGQEDTKRYQDAGKQVIAPRFYTSILIGRVMFQRNWS
jgi:hypothetical protein